MAALALPEVHEALERLGDNVALAQTRLVTHFPQLREITQLDERAERTRALLLEAVEALGPTRPTSFGSNESRGREALTMRYVEQMSIADMTAELSMSRRQVYRDLKLAESQLTQLLVSWACSAQSPPVGGSGDSSDVISEELSLFSSRSAEVLVRQVAEEALSLVQPLARQMHVRLLPSLPSDAALRAVCDPAFLRQVVVRLLSLAIQSSTAGQVVVSGEVAPHSVALFMRLHATDADALVSSLAPIQRLCRSQGIACDARVETSGEVLLSLALPRRAPRRVLVIEDNPGAVDLYRRYLPVEDWQVQATTDPRVGLELVRTVQPHVVVLDIMMPHVDGWTVLRSLKEDPQTRETPVLILSIATDPALARALGASASLSKPVSQAQLLLALHRCVEEQGRRSPS